MAPLPPRFRNFLNEAVKAITLLPRVHNFSIVTTNAQLSVLLSMSDLHYSRWQSGEICQVLFTGAFTLFCHVVHGFKEDLISSFVTFVLVSCSRVCLLDVSRLLGMTLRHFAPVGSCHWDSLTREAGNCARSRACYLFLRLLDWSLNTMCMCLVASDSLRGRSIHAMLNYEFPPSLVKLFFTLSSCPCLSHSFRPCIRDTPGRSRNVLHPGAFSVPSRIGRERIIRTFLTLTRWFVIFSCTYVVTFKPITHLTSPRLLLPLLLNFLCGWVCQWTPFWIPVGESFKKNNLEEWIFTGDDSSDEQGVTNFSVFLHNTGNTDYIRDDDPATPRPSRQPDTVSWEPMRPQDKAYFWERIEEPLPPLRPRCNCIHPRQPSPFPERLEFALFE